MDNHAGKELLDLSNDWGKSIVANDARAIGQFMDDDWVIVSQTGISDKKHFLSFVESGDLTHEAMEMIENGTARIKIYGDIAVLTGRVTNTAHYKGVEFHADEWTTDIFVKLNGEWKCVLSHITAADQE
jgi:ketosteroid isomerase-like protein